MINIACQNVTEGTDSFDFCEVIPLNWDERERAIFFKSLNIVNIKFWTRVLYKISISGILFLHRRP